MPASLKSALPALCLAALVLTPFFGKAFTIDDTLFLRQAEQAITDPWHPTSFDIVWTEKPEWLRMSAIMASGPTMAYVLVPTLLAGGAEWVAHLTQLLLLAAGLVATASLGIRLGLDARAARTAALLLAATPAVLAMASTAMPDVAAMSLAAIGIERLLVWRDKQTWGAAIIAIVALTAGAHARSHVLFLLPIAAALLVPNPLSLKSWRRTPLKTWAALAVVPVAYLAVAWALRDPEGATTAFAATQTYADASKLPPNVVAFLTHWSLALPLSLPWAILRWRSVLRSSAMVLVPPAIWLLLSGAEPVGRLLVIAAAGGLAAAVLTDILRDGWRRRDAVQLALGMALFAPLPVGLYQHFPSKYLVIAAPAAALLVARLMARSNLTSDWRLLAPVMSAGVLLGVLIVHADAAFADLGRRAATEFISAQTAKGERVWFAGHWGFQWYAERAGAKVLVQHGPGPRPGDLIVSSQNALGGIIDLFEPRTLVSVLADERPGGRIMSRQDGAGFYSNAWGYLPWTWSDSVLDRYTLWRMDAVVTPYGK